MSDPLRAQLLHTLSGGDAAQAALLDTLFHAADDDATTDQQIVAEAKTRALFAQAERTGWISSGQYRADSVQPTDQRGYARWWDHWRAAQPLPPLPPIALPAAVEACLNAIRAAGGTVLLFGGSVRDALLGERDSDLDFKVYGLGAAQLKTALQTQGRVHETARTFETRLDDGSEIDVNVSSVATPEATAALESDLTINALCYDPQTATLLDFYGGVADLQDGLLRHVSAAFRNDPLRVLRAMRFAGCWNFRLAPETAALAQQLAAEYLKLPATARAALIAPDRVRGEWLRFAATCRWPSAALRALVESGWIALYPELEALQGCPQDPQFHPEGDVLIHTGHVADMAAQLCDQTGLTGAARQVQILAALGHDLGKSVTTIGTPEAEQQTIAARMRLLGETEAQAFSAVAQMVRSLNKSSGIRSPGHAEIGVALCRAWLDRIGCPHGLQQQILPLVRTHMRPVGVPVPTARMVRRLARDISPATLEQWSLLVDSDASGRPPLPPARPAGPWLATAEREGVDQGKLLPLLRGADVLALGVGPGPQVGHILRLAEDAQIAGEFTDRDGALEWLARYGATLRGAT